MIGTIADVKYYLEQGYKAVDENVGGKITKIDNSNLHNDSHIVTYEMPDGTTHDVTFDSSYDLNLYFTQQDNKIYWAEDGKPNPSIWINGSSNKDDVKVKAKSKDDTTAGEIVEKVKSKDNLVSNDIESAIKTEKAKKTTKKTSKKSSKEEEPVEEVIEVPEVSEVKAEETVSEKPAKEVTEKSTKKSKKDSKKAEDKPAKETSKKSTKKVDEKAEEPKVEKKTEKKSAKSTKEESKETSKKVEKKADAPAKKETKKPTKKAKASYKAVPTNKQLKWGKFVELSGLDEDALIKKLQKLKLVKSDYDFSAKFYKNGYVKDDGETLTKDGLAYLNEVLA